MAVILIFVRCDWNEYFVNICELPDEVCAHRHNIALDTTVLRRKKRCVEM